MANYLVTGAAGFIASRISEMLLEEGHQVVGIDNLNHAYDARMKDYRLEKLQNQPGFSFYELDISDKSVLDNPNFKNRNFDAVFNLAARAGVRDSLKDPWVYLETNTTGTLNMLELCRREAVPKYVQASTSGLYGEDAPLPTPESADTDHPLQPYAASKKGAEALAHAYYYLFDIDVSVVRYFTVYGPAGRPDMVMFRFNQWIMEDMPLKLNGDGEQSRGFTYIDDIARGTISALQPVGYEIFNLGGHQVVSINKIIEILENKLGKQAEIEYHPHHPADMLTSRADTSKAEKMLNWKPRVTLEEGVQHMVDWYVENREFASSINTD